MFSYWSIFEFWKEKENQTEIKWSVFYKLYVMKCCTSFVYFTVLLCFSRLSYHHFWSFVCKAGKMLLLIVTGALSGSERLVASFKIIIFQNKIQYFPCACDKKFRILNKNAFNFFYQNSKWTLFRYVVAHWWKNPIKLLY